MIASVEANAEDATADEILEGDGLWAVPGLIDTHIHLALTGPGTLPLNLALGVTTVRDLGSDLTFSQEERRKQEAGAPGARLLYTGPMIDGPDATWPALVSTTADAEDAIRAVDERIEAGADAIKLYTTLELESLKRCIEHVNGRLPVTGHLGRTLASEAMSAGINGLEHALLTPYNDLVPEEHRTGHDELMMKPGFWQKVNVGWMAADLAADHAKRWIDLLVERDVSFCPTLTVLPGADAPDEAAYDHLPSYKKMREERMRMMGREQPTPEQLEQTRERLRPVREKLQELVGRVHEAGGRIISGTDTGAVGVVPGFSLHMELCFLSGAGLSNMDVIRASTARAAEALWRDDLGTVQQGKRADILLINTDPLADLAALQNVKHVIQDGQVLDPADLFAEARGTAD